ncbi:puromycin-sensitive aminopeptidase isoform X1 [Neodiprion pinetum]|uniref:puromycin-sensitive aminopeptidase isoform X1 n=1 Tax=Neodiprion pinetum TaxID=441929 RepID=UPI001EDDD4EF|nr:puromycin-sensitive aminopeptidase isoform X1 [Neodiprion pinetum]
MFSRRFIQRGWRRFRLCGSGVVSLQKEKGCGIRSSSSSLVQLVSVERGVLNNGNIVALSSLAVKVFGKSYAAASSTSTNFVCTAQDTMNGDTTRTDIMPSAEKKPFRRLPTDVRPYHYDISLTPDLGKFTFSGKENVHVDVKQSTDTVVLNSLDIDIKSAVFYGNDGTTIPASNIKLSVEAETATIKFSKILPIGDKVGFIGFVFTGELNDKMKGFYRSKYTGSNGEDQFAAVTQFEATDARRCFPCWDEPALKATFNITLAVPQDRVALSNMPVKSESVEGEFKVLKFDRTPIMSTYLVAVVVGEYDYVEGKSSDGVLVRVYTPKGKKEQGEFALEVATKVLPYYNTYFGIAYPLPKMDLIAIADFSAGAMENWGLVTYRETCLLVDPQNTSAVRKQWIALVVGHELAHQWFGNLVTMEWWTHLWLNEGYASFVEFLCVAHLFPEYDIWTQFVTDTYIKALELDALKNSHPIEVPVGHPSEIDEIFDDISYNKGASVIRMLHSYIGDEDFKKGMSLYLKRHSYSNALTEDLWAALEEASSKPVGAVMSTWTKQQGFPVLKVDQRQEGTSRVLSLSQERFLADGSKDKEKSLWMIPVSVSTSRAPQEVAISTVMNEAQKEIVLNDVPEGAWVKINPGTIGFYRTRYSPEALSLLLPAVKDRTLPPLDRLGLLDDLFAMVQAGHASTVEVLRLMYAFQAEDNYTVWSSIVNSLGKLSVLLSHVDYEDSFKAFGRSLMKDIGSKLGWDPKPNESHLDTLLRSLVLGRLAALNDAETIEEAKKRFEAHVSGARILAADLRSPVYRAVLSVGGADTYATMLKLYREADLHEEKDRISRALGAIKDEKLLKQVLEFAMSSEVRAQDTVFVIMSVAMTYKGRILAWAFFKDNWKVLMDRYDGGFLLSRLVKFTTENFATEESALEVEQFFADHPTPGTERTVQQSLETIRLNAAWLARDREAIKSYLSALP